jgi:C4-dicarboxylate-specific signal transduction histidine kinase
MDEALAAVEANLHNVRAIMSQLRALIHPDQAQREPADINQLVNEVLSVLRAEAQRHRISIDFKPAVTLPMVALDRVQISQVIFNLVRNAFDAVISCPPERRLVNISTAALPAGGIELTVRDHGSGIAPGAEKQIFEAFFTTKTDGMGIGLRIGRTITKAHGGRLEGGNNTDGPGAWFRMVLPG